MISPEESGDLRTARPGKVFTVACDIDASVVGELRRQIQEHMRQHGPNLCLDLGRVSFIDSSGLGMLVAVLRDARQQGGTVCLINPSREVRRVLQITGLENLFEIASGVPA